MKVGVLRGSATKGTQLCAISIADARAIYGHVFFLLGAMSETCGDKTRRPPSTKGEQRIANIPKAWCCGRYKKLNLDDMVDLRLCCLSGTTL